jgi:nicotinamide-nucleotide adenylyltransferase
MLALDKHPYVAVLGRWQPPHLGHQAVLEALCAQFAHILIGIGSANIQDYRNPLSLDEVSDMLHLVLASYDNYSLVPIADVSDEQVWCHMAKELFGDPQHFITANPYVTSLLKNHFPLSHPVDFLPEEKRVPVSSTVVRREMARGEDWQDLVPVSVREYILTNQLDKRFREAFGLHTLVMETIIV